MSQKNTLTVCPPICIEENKALELSKFFYKEEEKQTEFLRNLLFNNPIVLPINKITEDFQPLIPIAHSVKTETGIIDIIFINPKGNITVVETKVRGPVTPQIFNFRFDMQKWNYAKLDSLCQNNRGKSLMELIRESNEIDDESAAKLVAKISDNLYNGKFLLLIVSERMNTIVEKLFNKFPSTKNTSHFGIIKLNIYKDAATNKFIIIPASSFHYATMQASEKIKVEKKEKLKVREFSSDEEQFFGKLKERVSDDEVTFAKKIATDVEELGFEIQWKPTALIIKMPHPQGKKKNFTILMIQIYGECVHGDLEEQFSKANLPESIAKNFINNLIFSLGFKKGSIQLKNLRPNYEKFLELINRFKNEVES